MTEGGQRITPVRGGRHRAPKPAPKPILTALPILAVIGIVAVLAGGAYLFFNDDEPQPTDTSTPAQSARTDKSRLEAPPSVLESTRKTTVKDNVVTVREVVTVVEGSDVGLAPQTTKPAPGLQWRSSSLVNEDGSTPAFDEPLKLSSGRSVTVVGTYRLTQCPDILPAMWPTPLKVVGSNWDRTFTRTQVPLNTARAICPKAPSKAKQLPGLAAFVVRAKNPVVRLRWQGKSTLTVHLVGSASEVAVVTRTSACKGACVATIRRNTSQRIAFRPIDLCAVGGRSNVLTLRAATSGGATRSIAVTAQKLASTVCAAARN